MDRRFELGITHEDQKSPIKGGAGVRGSLRLAAASVLLTAVVLAASDINANAQEVKWELDPSKVVRVYTQCGGNGFPDNSTVMVQQVRNPEDYNTANLGIIAGQCGNRYMQPDNEIYTLAEVQRLDFLGMPISVGSNDTGIFDFTRQYPQCGAEFGPMDVNERNTVIVYEFVHQPTGSKTYSIKTIGPQPGQCGNP